MKLFFTALFFSVTCIAFGQADWKKQPVQIETRWAKTITPDNVLQEYPRPQMVRQNWVNLNGLWDYGIAKKDSAVPEAFTGKILVPFPIESSLSGVKKALLPDQNLWYRRTFNYKPQKNTKLLLHFGAVDYQTTVFVNGKKVGEHTGGYDPFSMDVSAFVKTGKNELTLKVWDPTDQALIAYGKQSSNPSSAWYTSTSGIWQTVWMETVPEVSIGSYRIVPDIDQQVLNLKVNIEGNADDYSVNIIARYNGKPIAELNGNPANAFIVPVKNPRLWSPEDAFLYDLDIILKKHGKVIDKVSGYFGMRKIEIKKTDGRERVFLNHKPIFMMGVLDQGFWPESIYTAPTDSAMITDIQAVKNMGFNTIRKHIKVEPARWYYHCDQLGILMWQDMPNRMFNADKKPNSPASDKQFETELKAMMDNLYNYPSIVMWCLFNERWGEYDQARLSKWIKSYDSSRILDAHTGWDRVNTSEITDTHVYCWPKDLPADYPNTAKFIGEFGGVNQEIADHVWKPGVDWGHGRCGDGDLIYVYASMVDLIVNQQIDKGLCGAIYTQPYDVEVEINGFETYDRKVFKVDTNAMKTTNKKIYQKMKDFIK